MATVELRFTALPSHVRTARLVAAAVARRSGVDEAVLDEVRLAVGEACSRAVDLHRRHCPGEPVTMTLIDDTDRFSVQVTDCAPSDADLPGDPIGELASRSDLQDDALPPGVGLAVISGLVDDVTVRRDRESGLAIRMTWPAAGRR